MCFVKAGPFYSRRHLCGLVCAAPAIAKELRNGGGALKTIGGSSDVGTLHLLMLMGAEGESQFEIAIWNEANGDIVNDVTKMNVICDRLYKL